MRRARIYTALLAGLAATTLASCTRAYDAWFANPCSHDLHIRTLYVVRGTAEPEPSDDVIAEATRRPEAVTKVEDAFIDANGFTWFVQVDDLPPREISKRDMPEWFVVMPSSVCS